MAREPQTRLCIWLAVGVLWLTAGCAQARDTEEQLLQRIQSEQNPVKKAKDEIKLATLKLEQIHEAYSQGKVDTGTKLLNTFVDTMQTSWKTLQDSGRKAVKQPDGFRDLEISLREHVRSLQDLERTVSYFDRAPLGNAEHVLEQTRSEVLRELFPGTPPRTGKNASAAPPAANPSAPKQEQ